MKAYQINIAPRTGGMGFVTVEKTRTTLLQSSQSLLDSIKIINAKIACGPECNISIHESQRAQDPEHLENQVGLLSKKRLL
jgi:hypothetical protein